MTSIIDNAAVNRDNTVTLSEHDKKKRRHSKDNRPNNVTLGEKE